MKKIFSIILFVLCVFTLASNTSNATTSVSPHWQQSSITVYIPQDVRAKSMRNAFSRWQNAVGKNLTFNYVTNAPADIDVVFVEEVDGSDCPLGTYSLSIQGQKITKAEIKIATKGEKAKKYSKDYMFTTMLHEVGHALGLPDTNRKKTGIMYMPLSVEQDITKLDVRKLYNLNNWSFMDRRI